MTNIEIIAKKQHELLVELATTETALRSVLEKKNNVIAEYARYAAKAHSSVVGNSATASATIVDGGSDSNSPEVPSVDDDGASLHASGAFYKQFLTQ